MVMPISGSSNSPRKEAIFSCPVTCHYMYTGKKNDKQEDNPFTSLLSSGHQ